MKEFLLGVKKRIVLPLALITLLFSVNLVMEGKEHLIGALLLGYITGVLYIFMQANRIKHSERIKRAVKLNAFFGVLLRFSFLFIVLMFALKISKEVFMLMTAGFFVFYALFYFVAILENLRKLSEKLRR